MGAEVAAVFDLVTKIATVVKGTSEVIKGNIEADELRREAGRVETQADIEKADAVKAADLARERGEQFLAEQALGLTASGIKLAGTPLDILTETREGIETQFTESIARAEDVRGLRGEEATRLRRSSRNAPGRGLLRGIATFATSDIFSGSSKNTSNTTKAPTGGQIEGFDLINNAFLRA